VSEGARPTAAAVPAKRPVAAVPEGLRVEELEQNASRVAALLKAIANPARLVILCQLAERERSVGELERSVGLSQSGISQHLAVLRRGDVVASRRDGQTVYYSLASREVVALMGALYTLFCHRDSAGAAARLRAGVA
jgi:DNA-binding transcriptional ArsR family regulator